MKYKKQHSETNHNEINVGQVDTTAILVKMSSDIGYIKAKVDKVDELEKRVENLEKVVYKNK